MLRWCKDKLSKATSVPFSVLLYPQTLNYQTLFYRKQEFLIHTVGFLRTPLTFQTDCQGIVSRETFNLLALQLRHFEV